MISFSLWALLWQLTQPSGWFNSFPYLGIDLFPPFPSSFFLYRLLTYAIKLKKPVLLLNVGPTRADGLPGLVKLGVRSGAVLGDVTRAVMYRFKILFHVIFRMLIYLFSSSGARAQEDPLVAKMLRSGIENPPLCDDDMHHPKAAD